MRKRFIIAVDVASAEQEKAVTEFLKEKTGYWWHWIKNFWLTIDSKGTITAGELTKGIKECAPGSNILVLEMPEGKFAWYGFGPANKKDRKFDMSEWLLKSWQPPPGPESH